MVTAAAAVAAKTAHACTQRQLRGHCQWLQQEQVKQFREPDAEMAAAAALAAAALAAAGAVAAATVILYATPSVHAAGV